MVRSGVRHAGMPDRADDGAPAERPMLSGSMRMHASLADPRTGRMSEKIPRHKRFRRAIEAESPAGGRSRSGLTKIRETAWARLPCRQFLTFGPHDETTES